MDIDIILHSKGLRCLQSIHLVQLSTKGKTMIGFLSWIPTEPNALFQKLDLLSLFAHPPKWDL
ncbi:hypothetical protein IT6_03110 [Methylacidiphilum caldifontis]|uniref:hypothetical protein n=1 Tax=Methylacidiphilum caldifontis TaxID=2795386 RepID=UPI001A8E485B|nr:hypothetical protein [Methylacidiphilum caldifontis]QSR89287.1 hypothetical protein IT6_03110 [Methylacidiphilum caldifontis]